MTPFDFRGALTALALAATAATSQAADITRTGDLVFDTDVVQFSFTLASAGSVEFWTDSWQTGKNFDPTVSVFDASGQLLGTGDDVAGPSPTHAGQGAYDSELSLAPLAAGRYTLTLSASGNDPLGTTLADGFSLSGTTPIRIADWNQPSYDINKNDQKGTAWSLHLSGVDSVSAVPEPASIALMMAGGLLLAGGLRRKR